MLAFIFPLIILFIIAYKAFGSTGIILAVGFVAIVVTVAILQKKDEEEQLNKLLKDHNPNYKPSSGSGVEISDVADDWPDDSPEDAPPKEKGYTIDEMVEMDMMLDDDW